MSNVTPLAEERATAEAAAWLARLQRAELSDADGLEFDAWLAAAPANRTAYATALSAWHDFDAAAGAVLAELDTQARTARVRRPMPRRWVVGAGGFAVAAGLALAVLPGLLATATTQTYLTGKGQHQRVQLADGSVVDLNAETRLTVTLARNERRVTLADGEAIFDVTHDPARPFTVAAAGREVRVVGTQFDVKSREGELTVTVARGKVRVRPLVAQAAPAHAFMLTPGERLEVAEGGAEHLRAVDPQETFSWRAGRLVYRNQPLSDVVADLNRQFTQQIEIGDPELAQIPITGVIVLDDPDAIATRLSLMLPVRSVPSERGLLLLKK
jgi:transmembrane sensor